MRGGGREERERERENVGQCISPTLFIIYLFVYFARDRNSNSLCLQRTNKIFLILNTKEGSPLSSGLSSSPLSSKFCPASTMMLKTLACLT